MNDARIMTNKRNNMIPRGLAAVQFALSAPVICIRLKFVLFGTLVADEAFAADGAEVAN